MADQENTVSVGSAGNERRVTNVAAGGNATDAVNVGQLTLGLGNAVTQANQYTDNRMQNLQNNMNDVAKRAYAGVAAAMSLESAPYVPGKWTYAQVPTTIKTKVHSAYRCVELPIMLSGVSPAEFRGQHMAA